MTRLMIYPEIDYRLLCRNSGGQQNSYLHFSRSIRPAPEEEARLAISGLEATVQGYLDLSIARNTYSQGIKRYTTFCSAFNICPPFPLTESLLCSFASHLGSLHLSPQTIKTYLAAVKFQHAFRIRTALFLQLL